MKFYRAEGVNYENGGSQIVIYEYSLYSETPKGYWISYWPDKKTKWKWISKTSRKRFAYPTKAEALESFRQRQVRRIAWGKCHAKEGEKFLALVEEQIKAED